MNIPSTPTLWVVPGLVLRMPPAGTLYVPSGPLTCTEGVAATVVSNWTYALSLLFAFWTTRALQICSEPLLVRLWLTGVEPVVPWKTWTA
ncbi:MAG: hypothetical protein IPK07_04555 [Deltaproteobacteria bacterium]|nr:hypothetical protein [Deltaproteobacteria bacterium]